MSRNHPNRVRLSSPAAVAMKARYGRTTGTHKDKRAGRGGQTNVQRGFLAEWEDAQEAHEDELATLRQENDVAYDLPGDVTILKAGLAG